MGFLVDQGRYVNQLDLLEWMMVNNLSVVSHLLYQAQILFYKLVRELVMQLCISIIV